MPAYFTLTLDTTAPTGTKITIPSFTNNRTVTATLSATGAMQMKIWGDVVLDASSTTKITESSASWVSYSMSHSVILTAGDGMKTVYARFRDDVGNESAQVSATVTLDTAAPVVMISTGPDYSTISEVSGYNACTFSWSANEAFTEYKVCVVPENTSTQDTGMVIGTENGSTNMSGTGSWTSESTLTSKIIGTDLRAISDSDGAKIIKVFVKDSAGNWSV